MRPLLAEEGHSFNLVFPLLELEMGVRVGGEEVPKSTLGPSKKSMRKLIQDDKGRATTSGPQEPTHGKNLLHQRETKRVVVQIPLSDFCDLLLAFLL